MSWRPAEAPNRRAALRVVEARRSLMPGYIYDALFGSDDVAAAIGSQLEEVSDVFHFEQALQRPVAGLYPNLYGGALRLWMQPEVAKLQQTVPPQGTPDAVGVDPGLYVPNWPYRQLLLGGLPAVVLHEQTDERLFILHDGLLPLLPQGTLLERQIRQEKQARLQQFLDPFVLAVDLAQKQLRKLVRRDALFTLAGLVALQTGLLQIPAFFPTRLDQEPLLQAAFNEVNGVLREMLSLPPAEARERGYALYPLLHALESQAVVAAWRQHRPEPWRPLAAVPFYRNLP